MNTRTKNLILRALPYYTLYKLNNPNHTDFYFENQFISRYSIESLIKELDYYSSINTINYSLTSSVGTTTLLVLYKDKESLVKVLRTALSSLEQSPSDEYSKLEYQ